MAEAAFFGPAGFPTAFFEDPRWKKDRTRGPEWVAALGLDCLELQMTYGPRMKPESADLYRERAEEFGIRLSVHASYYTVFTSPKPDVIDPSLARFAKTCALAARCGASRVILHPGGAQGDREAALDRFLTNMQHFVATALPDGVDVYPETAGKVAQVGSMEEILTICREIPRCRPCVDFGHLNSRQLSDLPVDNGCRFETVQHYVDALTELQRRMDPDDWARMHYHISAIEYGAKGEIRHREHGERIAEDDADGDRFVTGDPWMPVAEQFAEALAITGAPAWVISEAADTMDQGALAMKAAYRNRAAE